MKTPWMVEETINRMPEIEIYKMVSLNVVKEMKNALEQNRRAMFYPDETEYDSETKQYL